MNDKFDKEGKPLTLFEWGKLMQDDNYKIVKQEVLPNGRWISTVWLGIAILLKVYL